MIMAQRMLTLRRETSEVTVPVSVYAPLEGDRCWECRFAIGWPEGERAAIVRGNDGMQALYLAMQRIAMELYGSPHHASGALRWNNPNNGYGFPMAKSGYEDLVGDDRTAQVSD